MTSFTFPLSLPDFLDLLPVASVEMDNPEQVEISGTAGGEIIPSEVGPRLWKGEIKLGKMTNDEADQAGALIDLVRGTGRGFMITRLTRRFPAYDPTGTLLSGYSPVIADLHADNLRLKIGGLPVDYTLARGDLIGFEYGASPTRFALHRIATLSKSADGTGTTGWIELTANIRSGAVATTPLTLYRPACKAILVPSTSTTGASRHTITEGAGFKFIQTLR